MADAHEAVLDITAQFRPDWPKGAEVMLPYVCRMTKNDFVKLLYFRSYDAVRKMQGLKAADQEKAMVEAYTSHAKRFYATYKDYLPKGKGGILLWEDLLPTAKLSKGKGRSTASTPYLNVNCIKFLLAKHFIELHWPLDFVLVPLLVEMSREQVPSFEKSLVLVNVLIRIVALDNDPHVRSNWSSLSLCPRVDTSNVGGKICLHVGEYCVLSVFFIVNDLGANPVVVVLHVHVETVVCKQHIVNDRAAEDSVVNRVLVVNLDWQMEESESHF